MTNETLLAVIGETDAALTERADKIPEKKRTVWLLPVAACLLLCALVLPAALHVFRPAHSGHTEPIVFASRNAFDEYLSALPDDAALKRDDLLTDFPEEVQVVSERFSVTDPGKDTGKTDVRELQIHRELLLDGKDYRVRLYLFFDKKDDRVYVDGYEEQGLRMEPIPGTQVRYSQIREPAFTHAQAIFRYRDVLYVLDLTTDEADSRIRDFVSLLFR